MSRAANDQDDLDKAARQWIVRLASGDVDQTCLAAFRTWHAADERHAKAFEQARRLYVDADRHSLDFRRARRSLPIARLGIAASVILCIGLFIGQGMSPAPDYATPRGTARTFALTDGTRVILDGDSAITVRIDPDKRSVQLLRGRAHFDVVHERRPFAVAVEGAKVTDIGTSFAVSDITDDGSVAVTGGLVRVDLDQQSRTLSVGQAASWKAGGKLAAVDAGPDNLGWVHGQVIIRDRPFRDAAAELSRYISGRVWVIGDIGNARVGGTFSTARAEEGLAALARSQGAHIRKLWGFTMVVAD